MSHNQGRYIVLEGTEGVGKTTLCGHLNDHLAKRGVSVKNVREPGGTALGETVRELVLRSDDLSDWTEALLFAAQRAELLSAVVGPALHAGTWVRSDRSFYSSLAYPGPARGLGMDRVWAVNAPATETTPPDLVIWLETDHRIGLDRQSEPDRIGGADPALHYRVWKGYRRLWANAPHRLLRVDSGTSPERNAQLLMSVFEERGWLDKC